MSFKILYELCEDDSLGIKTYSNMESHSLDGFYNLHD